MIKNKFLFAIILVYLTNIIYPQDDLRFEHLSLQDGVTHNLTNCMMKDSKGFLWFGTTYGLARYEGSDYTVFKNDPEDPKSISFDDIVSLFEDKNGNIWIGTNGGGLNKYNPYNGEFARFIYRKDNPNGINDNIIWAICEDKEGNIWLGTESGGLNQYNPETDKFIQYKHDESNPNSISSNTIFSLLLSSKGDLWIGSKEGLSRFNYDKKSFENFTNNPDDRYTISRGAIKVIYEDSEKNLWIGTTSGLNKFDGNIFIKYYSEPGSNSLSHNFITSIMEDSYGRLWIGTEYGLNYFNKKTNQFTHFYHNPNDPTSISGNNIHNVIEDNSGLLWVNAFNSGINKTIRATHDKFIRLENYPDYAGSLSNNNVLSLTEGKDHFVWIGTSNGLNYYNPTTGEVTRIYTNDSPQKNIINALAADIDGNIWVGSYEGLKIFNPSSGSFYEPDFNGLKEAGLFSTRITAFLVDSLTVWIGTYSNGLYRLDRENNSLSKFSYEGKHFNNYRADYILTLYKDRLGKIWIGSYGGLMMYDQTGNSFKSYTNDLNDNTSLSSNYVFSIFEDSRKELWVGTANGLNRFIYGSSTFEHFFEKDGLPNSVICAITEDFNGELWISTNKGLSKFIYAQRSFTNYDVSDGVGGNLFNPSAGFAGAYTNIVFGGYNGCTIIYPGEMKFSDFNPPVYVSSIKKINSDGESSLLTSFTDEVEISNSEKIIIINFASLDFSNPSKNKYAYMLEGVDNKWINAGNKKSVTYTNLEPGEYLLRVRGTNSDGVFSNSIAELKIIIVPFFWQTWWFQLICVIFIILVIFIIVRLKVREKINRAFEVLKIREEEAANIRRQTAIDFHDELGHKLTRISLLSEVIRKKLHNTFNDIDPLLKKISENSHNLYEGTRDFIWAIDPGQNTLYDLVIRIKDFGDELLSSGNIKFTVKGIDESRLNFHLNVDWKRNINLIFKEAMNNALKYSECKNVTLEILIRNESEVEILLFDDGKGFDSEKIYDGNGLKNMRQHAEKIDGIADIDSRPNIGTKILFKGKIPFNYLDYSRNVA